MLAFCTRLFLFCWISLISLEAYPAAPVVDEQENFAMLDDEPLTESTTIAADDIPLARDNTGNSSNFQNNAQVLNEIKGLQQSIDELRGQLEIQAQNLKQLREQQLSFYKDLDARLSKKNPDATEAPLELSDSNKAIKPSSIKDVETQTPQYPHRTHNPADEQISYMAAYDLVKTKHFDNALTAMQAFAIDYPDGGYTANAHYWLGELYIIKKNYAEAVKQFETVLTKFPASSKAAASSLKIGYALAASGQKKEARQRLEAVIKTYPNTPTAQLAQAKLDTLNLL